MIICGELMKMNKSKNQKNIPAGGLTRNQRRSRRRNKNQVLGTLTPNIPSYYPSAPGDTMVMPFKVTGLLTIPTGSDSVGRLLVLGKGVNSTGYSFLSQFCAQFTAMQNISTRWMISSMKVEVRATGVGGSSNTFIAASYIPSNTSVDNPPTGLEEVSQAVHYAESSLGTVGSFTVRPSSYFNDWRQISDSVDDSDAQAGLIQLYGSGTSGSSGVTAGVFTLSGTIVFCGFRV